MRKIHFILLALLCTFGTQAQKAKKYNSLFWEITGNGLKKPSYLYGTMHVSNKVAFHLSDSFFIALQNVDEVALETNPEIWMDEMYGKPKNEMEINFRQQQTSSSPYKNSFYLSIPGNRELKSVLKYYPYVVNSLLYRKRDGNDNFEENTYLDLFILQTGRKYGKSVVSLEDYDYSQQLVSLASESLYDNDEEQMSYNKRNKLLKGTSYSDIVEDAYRRGDLDYLDSISKVFYPSKNYNKYMLDMRNEIMAKGMDSIMKLHPLFTGVGAAHLPGDMGVINLLQKKGYKLRPVFLGGELESKKKEEAEKINYPVTFKKFTDADSIFSVEAPGTMYDVARFKSHKYFLYPDMVNGCFYMVMIVQNYASLIGVKPTDYQKKVDSLLFENIPGKILKKTPFVTDAGYNGYEIENVTKRGDYQHYKIIFTPAQLFVVRVNGNGDYAKGKEALRFINSFVLNDVKSKNFKKQKFAKIGASVYMPSRLQTQSSEEFNYRNITNFVANGVDENSKQYTFVQASYHDFKYMEEDTFELNIISETFCKEQGFKLKSRKLLSKTTNPSMQFTATNHNSEFYGRIVVAQPFYYMLLTNAKDKNSEMFFNSLELSNPEYKQTFETFTDTTLFFKVNTIKMVDKERKNLAVYVPKKVSAAKLESEPKKYYFSRTHFFSAPGSSECVEVDAIRFSKYTCYNNSDTFWTKRFNRYTFNNDLVLKNKKLVVKPGREEGYATYTDTNTNQVISMRMILKGEVLYVIRANTDSTRQYGKFVREFFRTFEPTDTLIGKSIYTSKASDFFTDLYSKDKPTYLSAREALRNNDVDFWPADDSILLANIRRKEFNGLPMNYKTTLIKELSWSKNPSMHLEMKKLYEAYNDSSDIQLLILQAMAKLKTEASAKTLLDILINETPPLNSKEESMDILYPYFDTLALSKHLFPKLLDLTRYSEYKNSIHKLLAFGVYNGVISKDIYASYKPFLLKECKDELKRQFSNEKESSKRFPYSGDTKADPAERDVFVYSENSGETSLGNDHLYALYILVEPFKDEAPVKQLLEKVQRLDVGPSKVTILSYLMSKKVAFPDSIIKSLAASNEARLMWYNRLKKYDLLNSFDKKYLTQQDFAYTIALGDRNIVEGEDTVKFLEKRLVSTKNHPGAVYFYKMKKKDATNYFIYTGGLFPTEVKQIVPLNVLYSERKSMGKGDVEKELIDESVENIRTKNRKRMKSSYSSYDYY